MKRAVLRVSPHTLVAALFLTLSPAPEVEAAVDIGHDAVGCVVAGKYPRFEAQLTPASDVGRARLHFRPENGRHWYSVPLAPEGGGHVAVLPRPRKQLDALRYYIEVADRELVVVRTQEFVADVVSGPGACQDKKIAVSLASAAVSLQAPAGAPAIPVGFSGSGVTAAGAGAAAAAGGSKGLLIGAGVAAVVGGGVAVAAGGGGGDDGGDPVATSPTTTPGTTSPPGTSPPGTSPPPTSPGTGPTPSPTTPFYSISFRPSPPGMDVSSCTGRSTQWSSQAASADSNGNIDNTWSPNEPNTMRIVGTVTATTFQASLSCVSGSGTGGINASGTGGSYSGTWSFAGNGGTVNISRQQ